MLFRTAIYSKTAIFELFSLETQASVGFSKNDKKISKKNQKIADFGVTQNSVVNTLLKQNLVQVQYCSSYLSTRFMFISRKRVRKTKHK